MYRKNAKKNDVKEYLPNPNIGLSDEDVKNRVDAGLVNKIPKVVTKSYFKIFLDNVLNFFNILIFALSIYMIIIGAGPTKLVSLYLLLINIAIGLFQDIKARRKVDKLRLISSPTAKVIRNGKEIIVAANEIVLNDIIVLKLGDQIVSDAIVVEGNIEVNESLLTGESLNVTKSLQNMVYSGSYVTSGTAKVCVTKVGKDNYASSLQNKAKKFKRPKSEILSSIRKIFIIIGVFVVVLGVMMLVTYWLDGKFTSPDLLSNKNTGIGFASSIFAMIPIGMYLLTSLTLAVGVIRLAKRKMLVQELYCIETLARVDVLCFDKTGTLTDGTMSLKDIKLLSDKENEAILTSALYTLVLATGDENATALAIKKDLDGTVALPFASSLPFSSARKYSAVMLNDGRCYVLGAREFLNHEDDGLDSLFQEYEKQGYRVLMLGYSKTGLNDKSIKPTVEPLAIIVLEEHIKDDAYKNIEWFKNNGVQIKIISGDNPISVAEIATRVGVNDADKYISLEGKSLEEVKNIANEYTVFGRVTPEQKEALISSMQDAKHVVAMTGDGVNDILALKIADCSIAMASGSDAAKAISHLVSMDSNFSSLPDVVAEGRRVINNLQRSCSIFLVKTIFAMLITFIFLVGSWVSNGKIAYPFETNNMYIWELLTIGFASFFLSLQPNDERIKNSFISNIINKSLPGGVIQTLSCLTIFIIHWVNPDFLSLEAAISSSVVVFSLISYVTLLIVSWPYDIYRTILCGAIGILLGSFFLIDYFAFNTNSIFDISYDSILSTNYWLIFVVLIVAIPLYLLLTLLITKFQNHKSKKERENENQPTC